VSAIHPGNLLYRSRKRVNVFLLAISSLALAFGLFWLVWILGTLLYEGGTALARAAFYYQMTPPPGADGGLANAIAGSLIMVAAGTLIGTPVGILAGTYLAEFGRRGQIERTFNQRAITTAAHGVALGLAAQTVFGAAKMILETGKHPSELKDIVATPGGTTFAGLKMLEKGNFRSTVMDAVEAATAKSRELGKSKELGARSQKPE